MDLRLENLSKRFGQTPAVEISSLTIARGEFFSFVGPSGCGKTTTLNLIAGLEAPTTGTLRLGQRLLNDLPPHKRDIAFVFQSYALYPHRTVARNLAFPLELAGVPRAEIRRRVEQVAALIGLTPLLEKRPALLSGGERQRVALGRAIVRQPQLFLFDEPLSNLDAPLRAQMRKELKRLHRQLGTTFLYVTHDQEEALSLSDRIAVMKAGHIQQCAPPREIYDQPATLFVAKFFGSPPINLFDAQLETEKGKTRLALAGASLPAPGLEAPLTARAPVIAGIRPEHVRVSASPQPDAWPAQVALTELHGGQTYLELEVNGVKITAADRAEAAYRPGQQVSVLLPPERLHFFDAQTEERLPARHESA